MSGMAASLHLQSLKIVSQRCDMERQLYAAIRDLVVQAKPWQSGFVKYTVSDDEKFDLGRVASRVYGRHDLFFVVQAAAGLDSVENPLEVGSTLVLPSLEVVRALYRRFNIDFGRG